MQSDNISSLGAAIGGGGHIDELSTAIKVALDRKGILKDVKARIRAEVFHALEDKTVGIQEQQPEELMIASELVSVYIFINAFDIQCSNDITNIKQISVISPFYLQFKSTGSRILIKYAVR